ncbi:unnamed protein product [Cunninghamella blakesleeana]
MDKLSSELISEVFLKLSQRYLATCSLVCKDWNLIRNQPIFYKTIELNSASHIIKFIDFAQSTFMNLVPVGHHVKEIHFYNENIIYLDRHTLISLITVCPFVKEFNELPHVVNGDYSLISSSVYWKHLTKIPLSYTKSDSKWMQYMYDLSNSKNENDKTKVTSVSIDLDASKYIQLSKSAYSEMKTDSKQHMKFFMIQDQMNCQLPKRECDFIHDEINIIFDSQYWKLPSSFINLKRLYLDFEMCNISDSFCFYKFNETTLESFSETCPLLTHLTLRDFYFNLSSKFNPNLNSYTSINFNSIQPSQYLRFLHLNHCHLLEPNCYKYIQHKYPNLISLKLYLIYLPTMKQRQFEYKTAIGSLITSYHTLTILNVYFASYCRNCYLTGCNLHHIVTNQGFWPHKEIQEWLIEHPYQLTELYYPFDLFSIEKEYNDSQVELNTNCPLSDFQKNLLLLQSRNYLNHLTTLGLILNQSSKDTLNYLNYQNINNQVSYSSSPLLTNLKYLSVKQNERYSWYKYASKFKFFINTWLNLFSSLEKLEIVNLWIQHDNEIFDSGSMKQQKMITLTLPRKITSDDNYSYSILKVLTIKSCRICHGINEINAILNSLIYLNSLSMIDVCFTAEPMAESFTLYMPHLDFSYLQLVGLTYDQHILENINPRDHNFPLHQTTATCKCYYMLNIKVQETVSTNIITKKFSLRNRGYTPSDLWFNVICRSVDNLFT